MRGAVTATRVLADARGDRRRRDRRRRAALAGPRGRPLPARGRLGRARGRARSRAGVRAPGPGHPRRPRRRGRSSSRRAPRRDGSRSTASGACRCSRRTRACATSRRAGRLLRRRRCYRRDAASPHRWRPARIERVGDVLAGQTLFWVGDRFGFGFYRAGTLAVAFVFDAERGGLKDTVKLPFLPGEIVGAECTLDDERAWLFLAAQHRGRTVHQCVVVAAGGDGRGRRAGRQRRRIVAGDAARPRRRGRLPPGRDRRRRSSASSLATARSSRPAPSPTPSPSSRRRRASSPGASGLLAVGEQESTASPSPPLEQQGDHHEPCRASAARRSTTPGAPSAGRTPLTKGPSSPPPLPGARRTRSGPPRRTQHNVHLLLIDVQKDFCFPEGSLYVAGRSGRGAIDDSRRIAEFVYRNLGAITDITTTHGHALRVPDLLPRRSG